MTVYNQFQVFVLCVNLSHYVKLFSCQTIYGQTANEHTAKGLKGGWHGFQYFDHKSSWHWDLWENLKKNIFSFQKI